MVRNIFQRINTWLGSNETAKCLIFFSHVASITLGLTFVTGMPSSPEAPRKCLFYLGDGGTSFTLILQGIGIFLLIALVPTLCMFVIATMWEIPNITDYWFGRREAKLKRELEETESQVQGLKAEKTSVELDRNVWQGKLRASEAEVANLKTANTLLENALRKRNRRKKLTTSKPTAPQKPVDNTESTTPSK